MLTIIQQIGVCLLGWVVLIFVIHAIFTRIERETTRDKDDDSRVSNCFLVRNISNHAKMRIKLTFNEWLQQIVDEIAKKLVPSLFNKLKKYLVVEAWIDPRTEERKYSLKIFGVKVDEISVSSEEVVMHNILTIKIDEKLKRTTR